MLTLFSSWEAIELDTDAYVCGFLCNVITRQLLLSSLLTDLCLHSFFYAFPSSQPLMWKSWAVCVCAEWREQH